MHPKNKSAKILQDYGLQLVWYGFVTLLIRTPGRTRESGGDTRKILVEAGERAGVQPLSFLAYTVAQGHTLLARMPKVAPSRVGIIGLSYGGKWAMFAACLCEKFTCDVWSDPGKRH